VEERPCDGDVDGHEHGTGGKVSRNGERKAPPVQPDAARDEKHHGSERRPQPPPRAVVDECAQVLGFRTALRLRDVGIGRFDQPEQRPEPERYVRAVEIARDADSPRPEIERARNYLASAR
jgi:hypothetical protein